MHKRLIAIFAHNEEEHIIRCIESVMSDDPIYVLVNGCSDNTLQVVTDYAVLNKNVVPLDIAVGDKANAWNYFVHDVRLVADYYVFLDGDCRIVGDAILQAENELSLDNNKDYANGLAATPLETTKNRITTTNTMLRQGGVAGNLYVLTDRFVKRIREQNICLPVGTIGEDGLVAALAHWDLSPFSQWDRKRILVSRNVKFDYDPLRKSQFKDWKLYINRKIRYSCRYFQNKIITECFKKYKLDWLNGKIEDRYVEFSTILTLRLRGVETVFDFLALKRMRK